MIRKYRLAVTVMGVMCVTSLFSMPSLSQHQHDKQRKRSHSPSACTYKEEGDRCKVLSGDDNGWRHQHRYAAGVCTVSNSESISDVGGSLTCEALPIDITNAIFVQRKGSCKHYIHTYEASVNDVNNSQAFESGVLIGDEGEVCSITSNAIPNHDFNDEGAHFGGQVAEVVQVFSVPKEPQKADSVTYLSQRVTNAIMLNGVVLDMIAAGCYQPDNPAADPDGNVNIGCDDNEPWLLDPLSTVHKFGADSHNAHVQPGGLYHYHGNPNAMFDDSPGPHGSPVIGFAADGFPIYGSYFFDRKTGSVRKALSGYTVKEGLRPSDPSSPGGSYTGLYVNDYEYTASGDLDECNGMSVRGQYGYYVTDNYPWVMKCFVGTPNETFVKNAGVGPPPEDGAGGPPVGSLP